MSNNKFEATPQNLVLALIALALMVGVFFFKLFIFTKIWALIAVPMGAPAIGMLGAYGVSILTGYFNMDTLIDKKNDDEKPLLTRAYTRVFVSFFGTLIVYGLTALFF